MTLNKEKDIEIYKKEFVSNLKRISKVTNSNFTYQEDHPWGWRVMILRDGSDVLGWGFTSYQQALESSEMLLFGYGAGKNPTPEDEVFDAYSSQDLIYVACPYWDNDPKVRDERVEISGILTSGFIENGLFAYSPLVHCANLVKYAPNIREDRWRDFGMQMMKKCDILYVLELDGWKVSKGVTAEINYWNKLNRQEIVYVSKKDLQSIKDEYLREQK